MAYTQLEDFKAFKKKGSRADQALEGGQQPEQ
jgi:hypothetical protein